MRPRHGAIMDTRRYAKRQLTWFRNQMKDWPWAAAGEAEKVLENQLAGGLKGDYAPKIDA